MSMSKTGGESFYTTTIDKTNEKIVPSLQRSVLRQEFGNRCLNQQLIEMRL